MTKVIGFFVSDYVFLIEIKTSKNLLIYVNINLINCFLTLSTKLKVF